eukprot:CAMPEP_0168361672 /NCGR_PEP_ID=MMETSP0228-20121227/2785_1 /TAXON_ID=133427 /ORGANISM="Protoceratium reticulatum, Strain CCCM 535 (=CCMP 1889)" /LENGTH=168 /DNA_ID=CAMNT_0008374353 /DNA_START=81 /DNA_END=583 /DNA_ORIENTATION=+
MADPSGGALTFHLVSGGGSVGTSTEPKRFDIKPGNNEQVIRIGRASKNELVFRHPGISWNHCELRVLPDGSSSSSTLVVRDTSTNGTGLQVPGHMVLRLRKDVDTPVPTGAVIILPMKIKAKDDLPPESVRACFSVHLGQLPAGGLPVPSLPNMDCASTGRPRAALQA